MSASREIVYVASVDADGCIFNHAYCRDWKHAWLDPLLDHNQKLIAHIKARVVSLKPKHKKMFVGSNRQSDSVDSYNRAKGTDSIFNAISTLSKKLDFTLDKYLLTDTYNDLSAGTSFDSGNQAHHWLFDETKVSILYAQMHKAASEHPTALVYVDFYDDRLDILGGLNDFFSQRTDLVPNNVILRFNHYAGNDVTLNGAPIQGSGKIDGHFQRTILDVAKQANINLQDPSVYQKSHHFSEYFDRYVKSKAISPRLPVADLISAFGRDEDDITPEKWREEKNKRIAQGCDCKDFDEAVAELLDEAKDDITLVKETCQLATIVYDSKLSRDQKLDAIEAYQNTWEASGARWFARLVVNVVFAAIGAVIGALVGSLAGPIGVAAGALAGASTGMFTGEMLCRSTFFAREICLNKLVQGAVNKLEVAPQVSSSLTV